MLLEEEELPYSFFVSLHAEIELPTQGDPAAWINVAYPDFQSKIYCSYLPVTRATLLEIERESRELLHRQVRQSTISEIEYTNDELNVYGTLFIVDGEASSPIQFMLTDSVSHFFRGALYYERKINADSLAPVTQFLEKDIIELIQTFNWKN